MWESWSVALAGICLFAGLVVWDIHARRQKLCREPPRLPEPQSFGHAVVRGAMESITAAQKERQEVVDSCPDGLLTMLDGLLRTAGDVESFALQLARRADRLSDYLCTKNMGYVRTTLAAAEQAAQAAKTPPERESYEAAAKGYEREVEILGGLESALRLMLARLENIRALLVAVPPRIVQLQALSADVSDAPCGRLIDELRTAGAELDETEKHFLELSEEGGDMPGQHVRIAGPRGGERISVAASARGNELLELDEHRVALHWGSPELRG